MNENKLPFGSPRVVATRRDGLTVTEREVREVDAYCDHCSFNTHREGVGSKKGQDAYEEAKRHTFTTKHPVMFVFKATKVLEIGAA